MKPLMISEVFWLAITSVNTFGQVQPDNKISLLRDPLWQFIGVVISIAAIIISILLTRRRKVVSYRVLFVTTIVSLDKETFYDGRLEVLFDGHPLEDVQIVQLQVGNTGNQPIQSGDYESPLMFSLYGQAEILDASRLCSKSAQEVILLKKSKSCSKSLIKKIKLEHMY